MQYRVDWSHQSREKDQCALFLHFFAQFMHIMHTSLIMHELKLAPHVKKQLGLP